MNKNVVPVVFSTDHNFIMPTGVSIQSMLECSTDVDCAIYILQANNSLVNKDMSSIPEESIIGGIPAKLISTGFRRVESENWNERISSYFSENPSASFFPLEDNISHSICDADL